MAGGFGMYARNFIAGQGRYIPDTEEKTPAAQAADDPSASPKHDEERKEVDAYREFHYRLDCLLGERLEVVQHGDYKAAIENTFRSLAALATPKHDEGRIEAAVRLFVDRGWCDEFGTPHQDLRELLGQVLATQPAARRVTDAERRLTKAASEAVELIRSIPERKLLALDSDPHPPSALSVAADEIARALESFAQ